MCGRYTQTKLEAILRKRFRFGEGGPEIVPRYNIAPTQDAPVVLEGASGRELHLFRWGLVPAWAKDLTVGNRMINARAETLTEKPSFDEPLRTRRCLVLADGFYEWRKTGKTKIPVRFALRAEAPFAFAGLHDAWRDPKSGDVRRTFTIVTTTPNELAAEVHDRMPAILREGDEETWLDPAVTHPERLLPLLGPYPADRMAARDASLRVGSPANDDPECLEPSEAPHPAQRDLFSE